MTKEQVKKWVCENDNYFNGEDSFADYYHQAIKTDARKYSDIFMEDYSITLDENSLRSILLIEYPYKHTQVDCVIEQLLTMNSPILSTLETYLLTQVMPDLPFFYGSAPLT